MWMDGSLVAGKGWSKPFDGWSGEYRCFVCGMWRWGLNKMERFSEGDHWTQRRMYQERGIRDGEGKEVAGMSV